MGVCVPKLANLPPLTRALIHVHRLFFLLPTFPFPSSSTPWSPLPPEAEPTSFHFLRKGRLGLLQSSSFVVLLMFELPSRAVAPLARLQTQNTHPAKKTPPVTHWLMYPGSSA